MKLVTVIFTEEEHAVVSRLIMGIQYTTAQRPFVDKLQAKFMPNGQVKEAPKPAEEKKEEKK